MSDYIFSANEEDRELRRLRLLESVFDEASRALLARCGLRPGGAALEIGPGAGSLLGWLAEQVGPDGTVVGVDRNTRYLGHLARKPVELRAGDVLDLSDAGPFDLVHARYVLVHNPAAERLVRKAAALLKPGGVAAFEEPDFTKARDVSSAPGGAHDNVNRAMCAMFRNMSLDPALGAALPALAEAAGLDVVETAEEDHFSAGGTPLARMMSESCEALGEKYRATGLASPADLDLYRKNAADPRHTAVYYATVRVLARKR